MSQSDTNTENCDLIVIDNLSDEESTRVVEIKSDSDQNETNEELKSKIYNYMENIEKNPTCKQPPLVHLMFRNKKLADICLKEVESLIRGHLLQDRTLNILENEVTNLEIYNEFTVDNVPAFENDDCLPQEIPLYNVSWDTYLEEEKEAPDTQSQETPVIHRRKRACFNCGGDHIVNNCTIQLDYRRINKNRREMNSNSTPKSSRYHVESLKGEEHKKRKGVPGSLSEELREALDLGPDQLPPYIYKMRVLGYPPGWLKEAEIHSSGITMYDSQGKAIYFNAEDGEVDMNEQRIQYDPCKLIDYVGFNVTAPPSIKEENAKFNMPPIQYHHLRTEVEKNMKASFTQPLRKRKFPTPQNATRPKDAKVEDVEMEVEDVPDGGTIVIDSDDEECRFIPPLPREPLPPPPEDEEIVLQSSSGNSSPSLIELETAKQKLMKELEDSSNSSSLPIPIVIEEIPLPVDPSNAKDPTLSTNSSDVVVASESKVVASESKEKASNETHPEEDEPLPSDKKGPLEERESPEVIVQSNNQEEVKSEPTQPNKNSIASPSSQTVTDGLVATPSTPKYRSVSVTPGTPVLYENSPYSNLPSAAKFKEGVSDYLPFENLPESTGVYEKMRGILNKVRPLYSA